MNALLRLATGFYAPAGPRSRLSVFYFHRALAQPDPLLPGEPDARAFDEILGWIGAQFRVLDPLEACERLFVGSLPERPAVITFDDGYRDNHAVALPLLRRHRMKAAFFIATGYLDNGMMFNDRVIEAVRRCQADSIQLPAISGTGPRILPLGGIDQRRHALDEILDSIKFLPPDERLEQVERLERQCDVGSGQPGAMMMTPEQVADLQRQGMQVGGHTRTHPILRVLDDGEASAEISGGREDLKAILGEAPALFAYPNGKRGRDYDLRDEHLVELAGFSYAFATDNAAADCNCSRFAIPRFTPWDRTRLRFGVRALDNLRRPLSASTPSAR